MQPRSSATEKVDQSPLSLSRLREAFAQMLGASHGVDSGPTAEPGLQEREIETSRTIAATANGPCEINPRSVVEALLFVGRPDNDYTSAREMASVMRGVSPKEIDSAVAELNVIYDADATPYTIERSSSGYRLALRPEFDRMRDKFYGRVREAKLSPAALEVLSIIAYKQPLSAEEISELRGAPSGAVLSTLVRRRLVRLEHAQNAGQAARYWTTDRFLRLFGLENLAALPHSEELEKA
ncbi:MAG TPA: SMC-Scp complex subunit ScpB [Lacipirellulaceae bacterium]|nr:SMC-Scp complex subunit ScpB [Lacipirellulaceae bacterium]